MSRHFRILEKANLEKDLFGEQTEAETPADFPLSQEPDEDEAAKPEPVQAVAAAVPVAPPEPIAPVQPPRPSPRPSPQPASYDFVGDWREELAQLLGLGSLPDRMRIGVCPLGRMRNATETAAALGQWIAARSTSLVVIVEASFDSPHAARFFSTRRLGLAEAMATREPRWEHFIHNSAHPGLKVMPAGRNPSLKQLTADPSAFRNLLGELDKLFDCVIVLLPNPLVAGFEKLLAEDSTDIVFPVIAPGRVTARQAAQARRKLAAGAARVAAALVSTGDAAIEATDAEYVAGHAENAPLGDLHA
jgi:hypothetical protein